MSTSTELWRVQGETVLRVADASPQGHLLGRGLTVQASGAYPGCVHLTLVDRSRAREGQHLILGREDALEVARALQAVVAGA